MKKFGVEMEIVGIRREKALRAIRAVGVDIREENYNHTDSASHWKIVSDSSVRDGFEVVSPILEGEAGLEQLRVTAAALDDAGATADRSCGLHVHIDAHGLSTAECRKIIRRYAAFEVEIDAFMPQSRRANNNTYCRSIREQIHSRAFQRASTLSELAHSMPGRYFKINLQAYLRHGTIEFRQHSGSANATKVCNWVRFLQAFIDESCRRAHPEITAAPSLPSTGGVMGRLAALFAAQRIVSLETMMESFGWQAHTARATIARLRRTGLDIRPLRGQHSYELIGGAAGETPIPCEDSLFAGIPADLATFYRNRAAVFSAVA